MKILAIGAHFDDVELGCGGSLLKWGRAGHELFVLTLTDSGYTDANGKAIRSSEQALREGTLSSQKLGAKLFTGGLPALSLQVNDELSRILLSVAGEVKPDLILTHWDGDAHRDHAAIGQTSRHCFRHQPKVLMYRSNWYLGGRTFDDRHFENISDTFAEKLQLLSVFESEFERAGKKWTAWATGAAQVAGVQAGCEHAESFEVMRWVER